MKKKTSCVLLSGAMLLLTACGSIPNTSNNTAIESIAPSAPQITETVTETPSATAEPESFPTRQNGDRFEAVIMLEGMEEPVQYEHIRNDALGFEMDYDYEKFARRSEADRECFISVWDDPENPENYLELTYSPVDAETVAAYISEKLSNEYEILQIPYELERVGSCIRIEASVIKNTNHTADHLQAVYIIPASDGCRIATAHYFSAESEGFSKRFSYMLHTLTVMERESAPTLSDGQALNAIRSYCLSRDPDLENIAAAGEYPVYWDIASSDAQEIVVLFRSYSGAQVRYYIDRASGEAYVTEFVPGITPEEERTDERLNVWEYVS